MQSYTYGLIPGSSHTLVKLDITCLVYDIYTVDNIVSVVEVLLQEYVEHELMDERKKTVKDGSGDLAAILFLGLKNRKTTIVHFLWFPRISS